MLKSFTRLLTSVTGFTTERALTVRVTLPKQYSGRTPQFFEELRQKVAAHPSVQGAALTMAVPLTRERETTIVGVGKRDFKSTGVHWVSPEFFRVLGIPLTHGRLIDQRDGAHARNVAVVNEEFVRRYVPGRGSCRQADFDGPGRVGGRRRNGRDRRGRRRCKVPRCGERGDAAGLRHSLTTSSILDDPGRANDWRSNQLRCRCRSPVAALDRNVAVHDIWTMEQIVAQATSRGGLQRSSWACLL